jgi:hypothetical protein
MLTDRVKPTIGEQAHLVTRITAPTASSAGTVATARRLATVTKTFLIKERGFSSRYNVLHSAQVEHADGSAYCGTAIPGVSTPKYFAKNAH